MNAALLGQIAVAVLGVIAAAVPLAGNRAASKDARSNLQTDLAILAELPAESTRRDRLVEHIDASVDRLIADQSRRRDPMGVGLGLALILISILGGVWAVSAGGWWLLSLIPVLLVFMLGSAGLAQDVTLLNRDEGGRPLPPG